MGLPSGRGWSTMLADTIAPASRSQGVLRWRPPEGIPRLTKKGPPAIGLVAALAFLPQPVEAKDKVKVAFIGPLTGGTAANGIGGRNSAELAVKLRNADPKAKYEYELVVLDDECKPNVAVQVATKAGADRGIVASASHYCSVAAIAAVET